MHPIDAFGRQAALLMVIGAVVWGAVRVVVDERRDRRDLRTARRQRETLDALGRRSQRP